MQKQIKYIGLSVHNQCIELSPEKIGDMLNGVYVKDGNQPKMFLGVVNS